jgi:hypothetical protein
MAAESLYYNTIRVKLKTIERTNQMAWCKSRETYGRVVCARQSSFSVTYVFKLLLAKSISALGNGISSY